VCVRERESKRARESKREREKERERKRQGISSNSVIHSDLNILQLSFRGFQAYLKLLPLIIGVMNHQGKLVV